MTIVGLHDVVMVSPFADHMHRRAAVDNKFSFLKFES